MAPIEAIDEWQRQATQEHNFLRATTFRGAVGITVKIRAVKRDLGRKKTHSDRERDRPYPRRHETQPDRLSEHGGINP